MSTARLYVGNLSYGTTKETLEKAFGEHGEVVAVNIITDRQTGRPKGFAFVEMSTPEEADAAKAALNGADIDGRTINVDNAREQEQRRPGGFGGGGRGGYGGGGGGYGGVEAAATAAAAQRYGRAAVRRFSLVDLRVTRIIVAPAAYAWRRDDRRLSFGFGGLPIPAGPSAVGVAGGGRAGGCSADPGVRLCPALVRVPCEQRDSKWGPVRPGRPRAARGEGPSDHGEQTLRAVGWTGRPHGQSRSCRSRPVEGLQPLAEHHRGAGDEAGAEARVSLGHVSE